jgi:hypothetical protein
MGLGFSFKVMPGVRLRASTRGIGASFGPRVARVRVSNRGVGFSTGVGPVSVWTGGSSRRRSAARPSAAAYQRQLVAAQKQQQIQAVTKALAALLTLHQAQFPPAARPVAPPPALPDAATVRRTRRKQHRAGIPFFDRTRRRQARQDADREADAYVAAESARLHAAQAQHQATLDGWWSELWANDEETVLAVLEEAFEDNEAPAAAVGLDGTEVAIVMLAPEAGILPEQVPATTAAGNPTLKKMTLTDRASLYLVLLSAHVLLTVKEAFAVAPGLRSARVAVVRANGFGHSDCLLAAHIARADLDQVGSASGDAAEIVERVATEMTLNRTGRTKALSPVDLRQHPDLRALVDAVDLARRSSGPAV